MTTIKLDEVFIREVDVARALGQPIKAWQAARRAGLGPAYIRAGLKTVLYRRADVEAWLASRYVAPRSVQQEAPERADCAA
jgi:hypothetical protein